MSLLYRKTEGLARVATVRFLSERLPLYIVNEYPKSGGSWLGQMLAEALELPFLRNRLPMLRSSILHGHYLNPWGMKNVVVTWRDGRDVMVSWYYHCLFRNDLYNAPLVEKVRKELCFKDHHDVSGNLPDFIEYAFTRQQSPRFSWADFARRWYSCRDATHVYYENLRHDTTGELQRIVGELNGRSLSAEQASAIVEEFSFTRQSGRQIGEENQSSFMRKGVVGDWVNYFTQDAREMFDRYAGSELILLGYEQDRTWVKRGDQSRGEEHDATG